MKVTETSRGVYTIAGLHEGQLLDIIDTLRKGDVTWLAEAARMKKTEDVRDEATRHEELAFFFAQAAAMHRLATELMYEMDTTGTMGWRKPRG